MTTIDPAASLDSFERIYAAVRAWIARAADMTDVTWSHQKQGNVGIVKKARVDLTEMSMVDVGGDELRRAYDAVNDKQTVSQVGNRLLVVQVKVESYLTSPSAFTIMERIRQRAQGSRRSHSKELRDENISINVLGGSTRMPTTYDNRVISACVAELKLNVASIVPAFEEDFVEKVNTIGDIT